MRRIDIHVTGNVQGVFFRHSMKQKAEELGITGWVRNEPDGSVRAVAEGEEGPLRKLAEWCKKGTGLSRVDTVEAEWEEATGQFEGFTIR